MRRQAFAKSGWDVTPFLEPVEAGDVFAYPANPNAADVTAVSRPAEDAACEPPIAREQIGRPTFTR